MKIYALDIGGSSIKHGLVTFKENEFELTEKKSSPLVTNHFEELQKKVLEIVAEAIERYEITAVGISTTGTLDTKGIVVSAGHFEGYNNVSWDKLLKEKFVTLKYTNTINDGRASAWAEYVSNKNSTNSHIHLVIGTGVGGGLIVDHQLLMGDSGQAGYIGHMKISSEITEICSCGKMGCLEALASARGISFQYKQLTGIVKEFDDILLEAGKGDKNAIESINNCGYWLGIGLGNCMNIINPTVVSIGGGVVLGASSVNGDSYFDFVLRGIEFASHRRVLAACTVRKAIHGNDSGMIGASLLCAQLIH